MKTIRSRLNENAGSLALVALVVALLGTGIVGASAAGVLVTSKQIRNGSILTQDLHKAAVKTKTLAPNSVRSSDIGADQVGTADIGAGQVDSEAIGNGDVSSADIGNGQVTPEDVTMPDPAQLQDGDTASTEVGDAFTRLDDVGAYVKQDPTSALEVDWSGSAAAGFSTCAFQIRVDGQPSAAGAGVTFVSNAAAVAPVSTSALFDGLGAGTHEIEVWARSTVGGGSYECTVGPASAGISQTFVVSEQVV